MPSCSPLPAAPAAPVAARHAIEIRGLRKTYGPVTAIDDLDLLVAPGEIYAFLGPNGAGKTTTVEILEGFRVADAGHIRVLGVDPATARTAWRDRIGLVLQESAPDPGLTVVETLQLHAGTTPTLATPNRPSRSSASPTSPAVSPRSSPAVSGGGSTSHSPSSAIRSSSSSTNPRRASTPRRAATSGSSSAPSRTAARRSC
jgi:hypothetical protein